MTGDLDSLYRIRFDKEQLRRKAAIWRVLCRDFFQRFVDPTDTVLDLACGTGEFINNIRAAKRLGVDLREESRISLDPSVEFVKASATDLDQIMSGSIDVVFTSNFLEHLRSKEELLALFTQVRRILRADGRFLIMGPNIRCVPGAYWDFLDHHLPLTDRTVVEALDLTGFSVNKAIAKFLPYSTKSSLPQAPWLVALYLKVPLAWRILGKQFFVVGTRAT
jgi:ubiquinone/menaquinone biosynthesis C-methylase UbiE